MNLLRTDYSGNGPWRNIAEAINAVGRVLNNIVPGQGIDVFDAGGNLHIENTGAAGGGEGIPWSKIRFGWAGVFYNSDLNKNFVRIYKGAIQINNDTYTLAVDVVGEGDDPVNYATTEIVLTTDYLVVYAMATVDPGEDGEVTIDAHPTELPDMWTGPILRIPLYTLEKYTVDPPEDAAEGYLTTRWRLHRIHNLGDVTFSGLVVPPPSVEPAVLVWQNGSMQWVSAVDNFAVLQKQNDELVFDWTRQP
jgi:hypothetical protein